MAIRKHNQDERRGVHGQQTRLSREQIVRIGKAAAQNDHPRPVEGIQSRHGTIRFEDGKVIFDEDQPNES